MAGVDGPTDVVALRKAVVRSRPPRAAPRPAPPAPALDQYRTRRLWHVPLVSPANIYVVETDHKFHLPVCLNGMEKDDFNWLQVVLL